MRVNKQHVVDFIMLILWKITPLIVLIFFFLVTRAYDTKSSVYLSDFFLNVKKKYVLCSLTSISLILGASLLFAAHNMVVTKTFMLLESEA